MRYKNLFISTLACAILLMGVQAYAGTGKRIGTAGATELLIPVGAKATALGGANLATVAGVEAMYWNPAGVANFDKAAEVMFSQSQWIGDLDVTYLAGVTSLGAVGNLGVDIKAISFGDIIETTVDNPEGTGSVFSPTYLTFGLNYSRKMTDRIHFGATAKIVSEKIISAEATGIGFDLGLQYVSAASGLRLGVVLANIGGSMQFSGSDLETRVQLPGTEAGTTISSVAVPVAAFDLPTQLKFGVSYDFVLAEGSDLSVNGGFVNNAYAFDQYILGAEYGFNNMFFLRGAYSIAYKEGLDEVDDGFATGNEQYLFGPSFGAGFNFAVGQSVALSLDYAYRVTEFFDDTQWFCLKVGF